MNAKEPIVITGLGLATALGTTPEECFDAVCAGRCGTGSLPALEQEPAPGKAGGQVQMEVGDEGLDLPREARLLRFVIKQALAGAGAHGVQPERVAIVMGTTLHGIRAGGRALRSGDLAELRTFTAGAVLSRSAQGLGASGPLLSVCSACSSGLGAIGLGVTLIRAGEADLVVAGGYDAVSEYAYAGFDSLRLIAQGPVRPFGAGRQGMKTSEGYAAVVLEPAHAARARGARSRGYVAGVGETADAHHLTMPHPTGAGAAAAVRAALVAAGLEPSDISLISAHATATPGNDAAEHAALAAVFGESLAATSVVAFKSHLGHTLGGAGAVELVLSIMARERGLVPPTINSHPLDESLAGLRLIDGPTEPCKITATLNLSMGFGGANTCVVLTSESAGARAPEADPDEAVITGIGVVLPGAIGNDAFARVLASAHEGAKFSGGAIAEEAIANLVNARRVRRMSDYAKLTLAATSEACRDAQIADVPAFAASACALLGTNHGSVNFCETYYSQVVNEGMAAANPVLFAEGVPNAAAAQLSMTLGIRGGCQTIIGSRTAGLDALRLAAARIREGTISRAFVGAAEEWSPLIARAHAACGFDVPGGFASGAVTFVLESRRTAEARGARVLGWIDGGAQRAGRPDEAVGALALQVARDVPLVASLGTSASDIAASRVLARQGRAPCWSIGTLLPEAFSVGPLAALAAALTWRGDATRVCRREGGAFAVIATDLCDGASLLSVKAGSLLMRRAQSVSCILPSA